MISLESFSNDSSTCSQISVPIETVVKGKVMNCNLSNDERNSKHNCYGSSNGRSFHLVDENEILQIKRLDDFLRKLGCEESSLVKVISIFGNTGEGKSYTLNHAFFGGEEVFRTSASQCSGTLGVWAAYNAPLNAIILDTEGLLGISANQNRRTRLLLKVMAISDVVIYRTRAERLHNDLFQFLGDASTAYKCHFKKELKAASERCGIIGPLSQLGPSVVIFHETQHTEILKSEKGKDCIEKLKQRFHELHYSCDAFSSLSYIGTQTIALPTDFSGLIKNIKKQLKNSGVRSARQPGIIYQALQVLNSKFNGEIEKTVIETFPDQYFTCSGRCLSCGVRCQNTMNHQQDNLPHHSTHRCIYQHQFDNRTFTCKACFEQGRTTIVLPKTAASSDSAWLGFAKYAWSGYVLECEVCGIIYRSRQYWYGNRDPVETVVRTEIHHVWPGSNPTFNATQNAAQKVIDGVNYLSSTVTTMGAAPTKKLSTWMADCIAPPYWKPNSEITKCSNCKEVFGPTDDKHHCRACGDGFCEDCSNYFRPVPERGWGPAPVRVCKACKDASQLDLDESASEDEIMARKIGEMLQSTIGTVASAIDYPLGMIKDSARPAYWVPDEDILECHVCNTPFTSKLIKHHCRACGKGVCDACSPDLKPVPLRGWDNPVRVCKTCVKDGDL